jgi:histidinol-phosphate phosphatase family domain/HAD-superfamily hydrolase, subfamily IIIA
MSSAPANPSSNPSSGAPTGAEVTAFILAGGFGTRLRPVVADRPKVLAEVLGRPFVFHILDRLAALGVPKAVFCTGYMADMLEALVGAEYRGMAIRFSREDEPLGTGGALALALSRHPARLALAMNGDSIATADLAAYLRWHAGTACKAALLLTEVPDTARYGSVSVDNAGRVTGFAEKGRSGPGLINAGVYLLRPGALDAVAPGSAASVEADVFPALARAGELDGWRAPGELLDIGTPESYAAAGRFLAGLEGSQTGRRAVFLDRDGTVIAERHYLSDPAGVELLPGAAEGLRRMRALGLPLVLVTNQSGVGRGYFGRDAVERVHGRLIELLAAEGVTLSAIYSCPHAPDEDCGCRKPLPGLLERAARELDLDLPSSFVIGDKPCDIGLGLAVGATTLLVRTGYGEACAKDGSACPHVVAAGLAEAADHVRAALRLDPGAASS